MLPKPVVTLASDLVAVDMKPLLIGTQHQTSFQSWSRSYLYSIVMPFHSYQYYSHFLTGYASEPRSNPSLKEQPCQICVVHNRPLMKALDTSCFLRPSDHEPVNFTRHICLVVCF